MIIKHRNNNKTRQKTKKQKRLLYWNLYPGNDDDSCEQEDLNLIKTERYKVNFQQIPFLRP